MKPGWPDALHSFLVHTFLKGKPLKSIIAHHPPLESSQAFTIIQSGILLHLGSQRGPQIRASSNNHSPILNPVLIRQVAMQHSHLSSLEAFDALIEIKTGETFFQIMAEAFRQFASFDSTQ
jgi:hypothetical protein